MGLFSVNKTANPTDSRQAVDTEGQALQGSAVASRDEAIAIGGNKNTTKFGDDFSNNSGIANLSDGIALGGSNNQVGGLKVGGEVSGTINITSSEGVEAVTKTFADTVKEVVAANNNRPNDPVPLNPDPDDDDAAGAGEETKSGSNGKIMLGVVLLLVALAGWFLFGRKKKA
jgi:hypothetical protein